ncbi:Flap-structured DNA-binding and RNA-binding protein, partial [Massospora cicadina]
NLVGVKRSLNLAPPSNALVAEQLPLTDKDPLNRETRALELHKATLKLGFLDPNLNQRNITCPKFQVSDGPEASKIYSQVARDLQAELANDKFAAPAKALDTWAAHLNPHQLLTTVCLVFKRMDPTQLETVLELLNLGKNEPAFFFGKLTSKAKDDDAFRSQADVETINNLISALSFADAPARRASDNPFRYSMPITRDFSLKPNRYEPLPPKKEASPTDTRDSPSRPNSFHEENLSALLSSDWTGSAPISPPSSANGGTSPPASRIRPKSMYEPTNLGRNWHQEEGSEHGRHLPVGEADALTWNIPLSPTVQKIRHPLNGQGPHPPYGSVSFSEDRPPTRMPSHPSDNYPNPYPAALPPRGAYPPAPVPRNVHPPVVPHYFAGLLPAPASWLGFKEKPKRRSYGDHDISPHLARSVRRTGWTSPSSKARRTHPPNRLDVPAWLRSLRLHKYTAVFEGMGWRDIIQLTDAELVNMGISALGARRKMLKQFELIKLELQTKQAHHSS